MLRCTAIAKSTGKQCKKYGDPSNGYRCDSHKPTVRCRGQKSDGSPCGSRAVDGYDGYCGAAHDPTKNFFKPQIFRLSEEEMTPLRARVRGERAIVDIYTEERLARFDGECDHKVELQIGAHALNQARIEYHGDDQELEDIIPTVREYVNEDSNLGYTHKDINKLKGAGTTDFLNNTAFSRRALWTSSLLSAHDQLNSRDVEGMRVQRLSRDVTRAMTKCVVSEMRRLVENLERQSDNGAMELVVEELKCLRVAIKRT